IFDPFFTTRDGTAGGAQGQGLGLSVCLSIINRLGGTLGLRPTDGRGSCFEVVLRNAAGSVTRSTDAAAKQSPARPLRLHVVADEAGVLRVAHRQLRPHGVVGVSSGSAALALLAHDATFDAIVCDVMMQGMSGVELYEALLKTHPRLARRFVFLTGGSVSEEIERWLERARVPLIEKPAGRDLIFDAIARVRRRARRAELEDHARTHGLPPPPPWPDLSVPPTGAAGGN
ncbi:MAG: response regulator, partial [Myxococcota bacterium]|nr:response regulator [Myxococcota bacterium]